MQVVNDGNEIYFNKRYIALLICTNIVIFLVGEFLTARKIVEIGARTIGGMQYTDKITIVGYIVMPAVIVVILNVVIYAIVKKKLKLRKSDLLVPLIIVVIAYATVTIAFGVA